MCPNVTKGKGHDVRVFKESGVRIHPEIRSLRDTGYQGIHKLHQHSVLPKKTTKQNALSKEDKKNTRALSRERVLTEHVIGMINRFKIVADRYRNRRRPFALRFNLIAGLYNLEL